MGKKLTTEQFIEKAKSVHGKKYDYSKVEYVDSRTAVEIVCPEHGSFFQVPASHLVGKGCKYCAHSETSKRRSDCLSEFVEKAKLVHGGKYDYSKTSYVKSAEKAEITCPEHGSFFQSPANHLRGSGCPVCKIETISDKKKSNTQSFVEKAKRVHGDKYDYSSTLYINATDKVEIICPEHGRFFQSPAGHLAGKGCRECAKVRMAGLFVSNTEEFVAKAQKVHSTLYDYTKSEYTRAIGNIEIVCKKHGSFFQRPANHLQGNTCPRCANHISKGEVQVIDYVKSIFSGNIVREKGIIQGELDIYIPEKNLAIEYNGVYWHSEKFRPRNYHQKKSIECMEKGIQLIHIWEDDWNHPVKQEILKKKIQSKLGLSYDKVFARKCKIVDVAPKQAREFMDANHIQGKTGATIWTGLTHEGQLVACIGLKASPDGVYDLVRYATSKTVVGGFSKLLSHFKKNYEWKMIYTYAHLDYSHGVVYEKSGFTKKHITPPGMFYMHSGVRYRRERFMKHKLHSVLENFDEALTERENMHNNGFLRVYDAGSIRYEMKKD